VNVELILVPYDSGQRGVGMGAGPERLAGPLAAELARSGHTIAATTIVDPPPGVRAEIDTAFGLMRELAAAVQRAREAGRFPLVLAGNCNTAVGTVAGLGGGEHTAVLWFDAHGDLNTPETTISGCLDGMALAMLTGRCWRELALRVRGFTPVPDGAACLVGVRDLDPLEADALEGSAVRRIAASDVDTDLAATLVSLRCHANGIYVHVDLDVLDPSEGRANGYPAAAGGVGLEALERAILATGAACPIEAAALTAYDPHVDADERVHAAATRIARALLSAAARA
jgi:arginase